eukprot:TRINITY_DN21238_c0_g1_i1.p1 TRINITY_DN21238_c0_g1~~TRINITY_DN21238_c0_g1_i1.p1  ORF type:complete len:1407 (+),score=182.55 TRINITY_DN21238_c0_g1_i1:24-4223(+)
MPRTRAPAVKRTTGSVDLLRIAEGSVNLPAVVTADSSAVPSKAKRRRVENQPSLDELDQAISCFPLGREPSCAAIYVATLPVVLESETSSTSGPDAHVGYFVFPQPWSHPSVVELCRQQGSDAVCVSRGTVSASSKCLRSLAPLLREGHLHVLPTTDDAKLSMQICALRPALEHWKLPGLKAQKLAQVMRDFLHELSPPRAALQEADMYKSLAYNPRAELIDESERSSLLPISLRPYQERAVRWMMCRESSQVRARTLPNAFWAPMGELWWNVLTGYVAADGPPTVEDTSGGILADEMGLGKTVEVISLIHLHTHRITASLSALRRGVRSEVFEDAASACICGNEDPRLQWVQCEECGIWRHTDCAGYQEDCTPPIDLPHLCKPCSSKVLPVVEASEIIDEDLVTVPTTLIVCPTSIVSQWAKELEKHSPGGRPLRVLLYEGTVRKRRLNSKGRARGPVVTEQFRPFHMALYDVVLTTYDVLRNECRYVEPCRTGLRNQKRVLARFQRTPLVGVNWWRVVLDESQMVEGSHTLAATMARSLTAQHRWCVTGTPIRKGLEDAHGLLAFLQIEPFVDSPTNWNHLVALPEAGPRVLQLLRAVMWRTAKEHVVGIEIDLPAPTWTLHKLRFSAVEGYYYEKEQEECDKECIAQLARLSPKTTAHDHDSRQRLRKVSNLLLRLRQACCHPQVGKRKSGMAPLTAATMTISDLREQLLSKATVEVEECVRAVVHSCLGKANLLWLQGDIKSVGELYREVHSIAEGRSEWGTVRVDPLQRMHIVANLRELVETHACVVGRCISDDNLAEIAARIRADYIRKGEEHVLVASAEWSAAVDTAEEVTELLLPSSARAVSWWQEVFGFARKDDDYAARLLNKVRQATDPDGNGARCRDVSGLGAFLLGRLRDLLAARNRLLDGLRSYNSPPSEEAVRQAQECPRCRAPAGRLCDHCHSVGLLNEYEQTLFLPYETGPVHEPADGATGVGSRVPAEAIRIIKAIAAFVKTQGGCRNHRETADAVAKMPEALLEEYNQCTKLYSAQHNRINWLADLQQAATRTQLCRPGERISQAEEHLRVAEAAIPQLLAQHEAQLEKARADLRRRWGQHQFLLSLSVKPTDQCDICFRPAWEEPVVLSCGHVYCATCVMRLVEHRPQETTILCPKCRAKVNKDELCCVDVDGKSRVVVSKLPTPFVPQAEEILVDGDEVPSEDSFLHRFIKGDWGTKIDAVLKLLLSIRDEGQATGDAPQKTLVFSHWIDVLELVARALTANGVQFARIDGAKSVGPVLETFRCPSAGVDILLLPLQSGARGLNITEATHVVFVEPLLNPDVLAQAVGRIHRFGQNRATFVHLFTVAKTIEDSIHYLCQRKLHGSAEVPEHESAQGSDTVSVTDLFALFKDKLHTQPAP